MPDARTIHDQLIEKYKHGTINQIEKLSREAGIPADVVVERASLLAAQNAIASVKADTPSA